MKLQIEITKTIIDKSLRCGTRPGDMLVTNCALAVALQEIFPNSIAGVDDIRILTSEGYIRVASPKEHQEFIIRFDEMSVTPKERYTLVGERIIYDIPEETAEILFKEYVDLAQAIANAPSLEVVS